MAGPTTTTQLTHFIPPYWDAVLGENLYPNLYFYQFGTKRMVPRNFGTTIKIPRLKKQNIIFATTEGTVIGTCPISDQYISGTMKQYAGAYKHSDLLIMTALSDVVELSLRDIARDIAKKMDASVRDALSGIGFALSASSSVGSTYIKPGNIIQAVVTLDSLDNARPPDNHYPILTHPIVVYDIQTNTSDGSWIDVTRYTQGNVDRVYQGEVGRLYGARFVTSSNIRRAALSGSVSGIRSYIFGPDSFYVTEISDMTAKTYVKQLGSAGAADPVNQYATVGAKVYFGVLPATWSTTEYRMGRLLYTTALTGGSTT